LISLEATFSRVADIRCPIRYTGYVAQGPLSADRVAARIALGLDSEATLILVSAGSGTVGADLLVAALQASRLLAPGFPHQLLMFHGPHAGNEVRRELAELAADQPHVRLESFTPRFPDHVLASDLSISMAGYNTTMNLLACDTPGLLYPFDQNREQRLRLTAMAARGYLELIEKVDLEPIVLAGRIRVALARPRPSRGGLRLQGDRESAKIINGLLTGEDRQ
jgi:predicted glycosyltransferase